MRAARLHGHKDLRIEEVPEPICRPGTVKVRPRFNGLCGSDLQAYFVPNFPSVFLGGPHPLTGEEPPVVFGHEFSGDVTEVGDGVGGAFAVGDRVTAMTLITDGTCDACLRGLPNTCAQLGFIGIHGGGGGLSDAVVVEAQWLLKLPDNVPYDVGAMVEPLAVGWHAVRMTSDVTPETRALVLGGGPVGCAVILALLERGVRTIVLSEPSDTRRMLCESLGVHVAVDPRATDVVATVMAHTGAVGADVVYDCAGTPPTLTTACKAARARGQIVNAAVWSGPVAPDWNPNALLFRELSLRSILAYTVQDFVGVIAALAADGGKDGDEGMLVRAKRMITRRIPLSRVVDDGLVALRKEPAHCKILVDLSIR